MTGTEAEAALANRKMLLARSSKKGVYAFLPTAVVRDVGINSADDSTWRVVGLRYDAASGAWRRWQTSPDRLLYPDRRPGIVDRARESLSWENRDDSVGKIERYANVVRSELDAVRLVAEHTVDCREEPEGVVVKVHEGRVQVAWLARGAVPLRLTPGERVVVGGES